MMLCVENYQLKKEAKGYLRVIVAYARIRRRKSPARCGQTRYSSTRIDRKHYVYTYNQCTSTQATHI